MNITKILQACVFAAEAHKNQTRDGGEPYINHCLRVAFLTASHLKDTDFSDVEYEPEDAIIAAVLHDTVEDTKVSLPDIARYFGYYIQKIVYKLTNERGNNWGANRAERKAYECHWINTADKPTKTIRLCDIFDNTTDMAKVRPDFAPLYFQERLNLLPNLVGGSPTMLKRVTRRISNFFQTQTDRI